MSDRLAGDWQHRKISVNNPHPLIPGDHLTEKHNDMVAGVIVFIGIVFFFLSPFFLWFLNRGY